MTIEQLADLQLKQAKTHKFPLEGWDKVSVDRYFLLSLFIVLVHIIQQRMILVIN